MKFQSLFAEKNKKNMSDCHLLKFLPSMPSIKLIIENTLKWFYLVSAPNYHITCIYRKVLEGEVLSYLSFQQRTF